MVWERVPGLLGHVALEPVLLRSWWAAEGWTQPVRVDLPGGPLS